MGMSTWQICAKCELNRRRPAVTGDITFLRPTESTKFDAVINKSGRSTHCIYRGVTCYNFQKNKIVFISLNVDFVHALMKCRIIVILGFTVCQSTRSPMG